MRGPSVEVYKRVTEDAVLCPYQQISIIYSFVTMDPMWTSGVQGSRRIRPLGGDITASGADQTLHKSVKTSPARNEELETTKISMSLGESAREVFTLRCYVWSGRVKGWQTPWAGRVSPPPGLPKFIPLEKISEGG